MPCVRQYGESGPLVLTIHGGPGAPGYMAPVARVLGDRYRVIEPFQRGASEVPLTVARHVDDLHAVVGKHRSEHPPVLIGSSWGAMLALSYAAAYPELNCPLILIGCGTFDPVARRRMREVIAERMTKLGLTDPPTADPQTADPNERLRLRAEAISPVYTYEGITDDLYIDHCDAQAHQETWDDMIRLQDAGVYPAAFSKIKSPVLMIHGSYDPHPSQMVRDSLLPSLPQLEFVEFEKCGHYPWIEKAVHDRFFATLHSWMENL